MHKIPISILTNLSAMNDSNDSSLIDEIIRFILDEFATRKNGEIKIEWKVPHFSCRIIINNRY